MALHMSILFKVQEAGQKLFRACILDTPIKPKEFECGIWTQKDLSILGRQTFKSTLKDYTFEPSIEMLLNITFHMTSWVTMKKAIPWYQLSHFDKAHNGCRHEWRVPGQLFLKWFNTNGCKCRCSNEINCEQHGTVSRHCFQGKIGHFRQFFSIRDFLRWLQYLQDVIGKSIFTSIGSCWL